MKHGVTPRMQQLLDYLTARQLAGEQPPTYEEMAVALTLRSKSRIHALMQGLEVRGHIRTLPHRARTVQVILGDGDSAERLRTNLLTRLGNIGAGHLTVDYVKRLVREMPA